MIPVNAVGQGGSAAEAYIGVRSSWSHHCTTCTTVYPPNFIHDTVLIVDCVLFSSFGPENVLQYHCVVNFIFISPTPTNKNLRYIILILM